MPAFAPSTPYMFVVTLVRALTGSWLWLLLECEWVCGVPTATPCDCANVRWKEPIFWKPLVTLDPSHHYHHNPFKAIEARAQNLL